MADPPGSLDWETVHAQERAAIREPDGRQRRPRPPFTGCLFGRRYPQRHLQSGHYPALAELRLLRQFDYLRACRAGAISVAAVGIHPPQMQRPGRGCRAQLQTGGTENSAIRFLRSYSNYLTPKASFFSADTLTAVATYCAISTSTHPAAARTGRTVAATRLLVWFVRWLTGWEGPHRTADASLLPLFGTASPASSLHPLHRLQSWQS